jgi:hypothetical protein
MKKIWEWLCASNRLKHLGLGFIYGLAANDWYCAIYGGAGVSGALEFKDYQWGGKPDIIDFLFTFVGVMAGYCARLGFIATL